MSASQPPRWSTGGGTCLKIDPGQVARSAYSSYFARVPSEVISHMRDRVERCRRLAAMITDVRAADILRQMAEEGEADIRRMIAQEGEEGSAAD